MWAPVRRAIRTDRGGRPATMLNLLMAETGYATTLPIRPNLLYADPMLAATPSGCRS